MLAKDVNRHPFPRADLEAGGMRSPTFAKHIYIYYTVFENMIRPTVPVPVLNSVHDGGIGGPQAPRTFFTKQGSRVIAIYSLTLRGHLKFTLGRI